MKTDLENLAQAKEFGLITPEEESLWSRYFEDEEKAKEEMAALQDRKPVLSRMVAEARKEAEALRAEGPRLLIEFALSGDRQALADQRSRLGSLGEVIEDCEAALSAVSQKIEYGFVSIFSRTNLARTKLEGRIREDEQVRIKKGV